MLFCKTLGRAGLRKRISLSWVRTFVPIRGISFSNAATRCALPSTWKVATISSVPTSSGSGMPWAGGRGVQDHNSRDGEAGCAQAFGPDEHQPVLAVRVG